MSEIVFRGTAIPSGKAMNFAWIFALAITGSLFCIILLFAGKRAPAEAGAVMPWVGIPSAILLLVSAWRYFSIRGDIFVTRSGNKYGVTILDSQKKKVLEMFGPFNIVVAWELLNFGRGKKTYRLYMVFRDENDHVVLTLESGRNTILGTPEGWRQIPEGDWNKLPNRYSCSHISELGKVLRQFIRK